MVRKTKYRQLIHYLLIACIILIQVIVMIFFYNEYFNGKKLTAIEEEIKETRVLKSLTNDSRRELLNAQNNLQKYVTDNHKNFLESYFQSLRKLEGNIDSINTYGSKKLSLRKSIDAKKEEISKLDNFGKLIDSSYKQSQKTIQKKEVPKIKKIEIQDKPAKPDVEIHYISDSTQKKRFFPRLKDAIQGNVEVKRDTAVIVAKYKSTVDTSKVKSDIDSTIDVVNNHYLNEIKKYETHISIEDSKNKNLYHIYDNLIVMSNDLMRIYDNKVNDFSTELEKQYREQNSINTKIRRYSVLGLMVLMFVVLAVLMYYTKLSFLYEKELKEANRKINNNLNFKNRILGMLSHEVRAPLKIINLFIGRIQKKTDDKNIVDYLKSIEFTNNSLLIQANQILEYAKNQEKEIELEPKEFNLRNEIDSILEIFQPYVESRNNTFEINNKIDSEITVFADNIKIHQIFINILGNANKFTENGTIKVIADTCVVKEKEVKLNVTISDTGVGISKSDIEKIFEPYYQGMISEEIDNLGAGLGLNLCKEIVQLFNGTISAESVLGKGTDVTFAINLKKVE